MDEQNLQNEAESVTETETAEEPATQSATEVLPDETESGGGTGCAEETGGENAGNGTGNAEDETEGNPESSIDETESGGGAETETANDGGGEAKKIRLVYIGPSLTYEKLRSSQILSGTEAEIKAFMAPITEKYPEAAHLLVTPETLPEAMKKVESKNSILHKYYQDMLAKSRDIRKG